MHFDGSERFWANSEIDLPKAAPTLWKNLFTGEVFETDGAGGQPRLDVGHLLKHFPVALVSGATSSAHAKKNR
jgi:hypothetical protein